MGADDGVDVCVVVVELVGKGRNVVCELLRVRIGVTHDGVIRCRKVDPLVESQRHESPDEFLGVEFCRCGTGVVTGWTARPRRGAVVRGRLDGSPARGRRPRWTRVRPGRDHLARKHGREIVWREPATDKE